MAIKSYSVLVLTLVSPLLGLACSDEPPDPLDSADGFCAEWGKNACSKNVVTACQTTEDKCEVRQKDYCLDRVSAAKYTRTGAEECLEFIRDAYRDRALMLDELEAFESLGEPCDMLLAGTGDVGDECRETNECDTTVDLKCVIKFGETRGECQEPKEVKGGGRCSEDDSVCVEGFFCDGSHCLEESPLNETCDAETPCAEGLRCIVETEGEPGKCEPKLEAGDECETDAECASGICDRNEEEIDDGDPGYCVAFLELGRRVDMCSEF
jgi:hypothetical protein